MVRGIKNEIGKKKAKVLRARGYSIREISEKLGVSKGSVSPWVRGVKLTKSAQNRISRLRERGRVKASKTHRNLKKGRLIESKNRALEINKKAKWSKQTSKILCAMIYWCEGAKADSSVAFTNSDPDLIKKFLELFRESFDLDEEKFSVCVHMHEYHNVNKQIKFWSEITGIPKSQFMRPYQKKNGKVRIRKNYQGCVSISYYSAKVAQDLLALARSYLKGPIG